MALNLGVPAEAFEWYRVSTAVGNVRNQSAEQMTDQGADGYRNGVKAAAELA